MLSVPVLSKFADTYAKIGLNNIQRQYPHRLDLVLNTPTEEALKPASLHPAFYGSYDWHSSVHMHWMLAYLLGANPGMPLATEIGEAFDRHLTKPNIATECVFFEDGSHPCFERTYGWAWLLKLHAELSHLKDVVPEAKSWHAVVAPLASTLHQQLLNFLHSCDRPIRAGTHTNSAFALMMALDYCEIQEPEDLLVIQHKAIAWFINDEDYPAHYEPDGEDFLSGGMLEAALMARVLDGNAFSDWWRRFCPPPHRIAHWLEPVAVTNMDDARLIHLAGLNLSRAWCWRLLQPHLPEALAQQIPQAVCAHLHASLDHVVEGRYVGQHWLASFATLAMQDDRNW